MYGTHQIPKQRIPLSKKNKKWREECVDAFINLSKFGLAERTGRLKSLYEYYNGTIDEQDYKYVLKPYGKTRANFPSKLRNYPIIKPVIDLLLGEKSKRPLNYTVTVKNADAVSQKEDAKKQALLTQVQNMYMNALAKDPSSNLEEQEVVLPKQVQEEFDRSYVDNRAITGQAAINYIMHSEEVYDKFQKGFFHYLVTGEVYSHKGVRRNEPFYEILNPLDIDYDKDPDLEFVEDGDWAIVRKFAHASTLIDTFGDYLTPEQVLALEDPQHSSTESYLLHRSEASGAGNNSSRNRLIECVTVYWKSRKRIGFVEYIDENTGMMEMIQVEEGYRIPEEMKERGATIKYEWVNEVWEGTKIDGRFFIRMSPVSNQRTSLDNPSICKLPLNGRKYSDINSKNVSLVMLGIPYQLNYNTYKYRLELAIARSKDIIAQLDINLIPKKWDMDKFMYYVEGTGIAWIDYNKEGVKLSPQHQSVLDLSMKTMGTYVELLNSIQVEWERVSGVNRQRLGGMSQYDGKATSQQAIVQSAHTTEDLYRKFAGIEQRDLQALLDYSKEAWITGKKSQYVMPDGTVEFLSIDPMPYLEADLGIFMSDATKELEKLNLMKELGMGMLQNGTPASTVADIVDSESFIMMKDQIKVAEAKMQELEAAQGKAEQEAAAAEMERKERERSDINLNLELDRKNRIEVALISHPEPLPPEPKDNSVQVRGNEIKERQVTEVERSNRAKEDISRKKDSNTKK